jgi:hypothetical protein
VAERERQVNDASLATLHERQSAAPKHIQHGLILGKDFGFEKR